MQSHTQFIVSLIAEPPPEQSEFELSHPDILTQVPCVQSQADRFQFLVLMKSATQVEALLGLLHGAQWRLPSRPLKVEGKEPEQENSVMLNWNGKEFDTAWF